MIENEVRITLRLPQRLRDALTQEIQSTGRSMNAEIVARLEQTFSKIPDVDERVHMLEGSVSKLIEQFSKNIENQRDPVSPFLNFFEITDDNLSRLRSSVKRLRDFKPKEVTSLNEVKREVADRLTEMANMLRDD